MDSGFDMGDLAKNLVWGEGYSISEASSHLGLKAKEVTERLIGERLFGEIIYRMVVERDLSIGEIVKNSGFSRKEFMQKLKEHGHGNVLIDLARFLSRIGHDTGKISNLLGISREKVKKAAKCRTIVRAKDIKVLKLQRHSGISMMKPGNPKNNKEKKRPATISRAGLAEWCMQHYDKDGILRLPKGCRAPADLPRKYPTPKMELFLPEEPKPTFIPAPPLSKAECTVRGRNRIGYLRLF
ncbi:MAG: hypothetical protein K6T65_13565 [Peptococcaceae bacterium]|nr:hypothetical protein [Peptococcaceae bacterium]